MYIQKIYIILMEFVDYDARFAQALRAKYQEWQDNIPCKRKQNKKYNKVTCNVDSKNLST